LFLASEIWDWMDAGVKRFVDPVLVEAALDQAT